MTPTTIAMQIMGTILLHTAFFSALLLDMFCDMTTEEVIEANVTCATWFEVTATDVSDEGSTASCTEDVLECSGNPKTNVSWSAEKVTAWVCFRARNFFYSDLNPVPRCHVKDSRGIACSPIVCTAASAIRGRTSRTLAPNPPTWSTQYIKKGNHRAPLQTTVPMQR
jgi:hypothetical protein